MSVFCCSVSGTFPIETSATIDAPFASVTSAIGAYRADASPGEDDDEYTEALAVTLTKFIGRSVTKCEYGDGDLVFASGPAKISVSDGYPTVDVSVTTINNLFRRAARTVSEPEYHCTATFAFGGQCLEHHGRSFLFKTGCYDAGRGFVVYFNVFCHFIDTPRWANTPAPPIGSSALIIAAFTSVDDNNFCHYDIFEINFIRDKSAPSSPPKKASGKPSSPYKRKKPSMIDNDAPTASPRQRTRHVQPEAHAESSKAAGKGTGSVHELEMDNDTVEEEQDTN